jgi:hypothetical protein
VLSRWGAEIDLVRVRNLTPTLPLTQPHNPNPNPNHLYLRPVGWVVVRGVRGEEPLPTFKGREAAKVGRRIWWRMCPGVGCHLAHYYFLHAITTS